MTLDHDASYFHELQTSIGWGQILASFTRWCTPQPGQRTLDIGTGPGLLPTLFREQGAHAFGLDLDLQMLTNPLHNDLAAADAAALPFAGNSFDLVTASNVLYLDKDPLRLLTEMTRVTSGKVCLLNPSGKMTVAAAAILAEKRGLEGLARGTLINYAQRAEGHFRWNESALVNLFAQAGLTLTNTTLRMGDGLIRYAAGQKNDV